jgi:putative spermidine/putrescine transport system ATP-binding protein
MKQSRISPNTVAQLPGAEGGTSAGGRSLDPGASPGAAVSIEGVSKRYGGQAAVDDVSLEITAGEFVTFLGPSGSGKTTTLNMIAGFSDLDGGRILLDGRSIAELPPHKRNVGMVFQNYALFPHMTAFDNIGFPLKQRRVDKQELKRRVMEALELTQMEKYAKRYPRELSGGQQQRVAVARAIVFNPRVLLMDEPLGALDKKLRESIQLEIKGIHRRLGITFIYVTHDQEEALVLSDRIAIFRDGRIVQVGTANELYERPRATFVADFIGDSNLFEGRIGRRGAEEWLEGDELTCRVALPADWPGGDTATLVIRPERLRLQPAGAPVPSGVNAVEGTVTEIIYLGNTLRFVVKAAATGRSFLVRTPVTDDAARDLRAGDGVLVTWPVEAGILVQ